MYILFIDAYCDILPGLIVGSVLELYHIILQELGIRN
jgi:hypothetical protein